MKFSGSVTSRTMVLVLCPGPASHFFNVEYSPENGPREENYVPDSFGYVYVGTCGKVSPQDHEERKRKEVLLGAVGKVRSTFPDASKNMDRLVMMEKQWRRLVQWATEICLVLHISVLLLISDPS